ncbi:MAG: hypothetical protein R6U98_00330 [Pirellulaceae bacterium]
MESCPTQAVLPLVGLAADQVIPDRYNCTASLRYFARWAPCQRLVDSVTTSDVPAAPTQWFFPPVHSR